MRIKEITELVSIRTLQKIQDNFSTALGISLSIRNIDGELLTKSINHSKLWQLVHRNPASEVKEIGNLKTAFQKCERTGQIVIFERFPDTSTFASPIYINGKIIAFFVGGLVRLGNPNLDLASELAKQLKVDLDTYLDAYLSLPLFTNDSLEASANLIKLIGTTISTLELEGNDFRLKTQLIKEQNKELTKDLERTSTELDKSINRYKTIFETVEDGIYISSIDGYFIDVNQAGANLLGYNKPQEIIGKKTKDIYVFPEDKERYTRFIKEKGYIRNWIAHVKTPAGEEKYFETNAVAVKDKSGNIQYIQGIFRDVNHRLHQGI